MFWARTPNSKAGTTGANAANWLKSKLDRQTEKDFVFRSEMEKSEPGRRHSQILVDQILYVVLLCTFLNIYFMMVLTKVKNETGS